METIVLSLGGSIIVPEEIDEDFLRQFKDLVLDFAIKGNKVIVVCGGGMICRLYQNSAKEISHPSREDLDWIGIAATRLNAELVRAMFGEHAYEKVLGNPEEKVETDKPVLVAAGYEPGWSTDVDTVHLAKTYRAHTLINLSNVKYAYTKDPKKHKDAKKIERATWQEFRKIVGNIFDPGGNYPFDPVAAGLAEEAGLRVIITDGRDIRNLRKILEGEKFEGTVIE